MTTTAKHSLANFNWAELAILSLYLTSQTAVGIQDQTCIIHSGLEAPDGLLSRIQPELRIVPPGSSISLTVRQRGKAIYSVFFFGGFSSVLAVLAIIFISDSALI